MVEQQMPTGLGALDDQGVELRTQRQPVGTTDATVEQQLDRLGDDAGISGHLGPPGQRLVRRYLHDPGDSTSLPAVEDGDVLRCDDFASGPIEILELDVLGATIPGTQLGAVEREVRVQLDEREHHSSVRAYRLDARDLWERHVLHATEVGRRMLPTERSDDVDKTACRETR